MSSSDLAIHMSTIEADLTKDLSLLSALDDKLVACTRERDSLGMAFWSDRVIEKRKNIETLKAELIDSKRESLSINEELEGGSVAHGVPGSTLRDYAESEEKEELLRQQETLDELAAWRAGNDDNDRHLFPPLETLLQHPPPPPPPFSRFAQHHRRPHGHFGHFGGPPPPFPPHQPGAWERRGHSGHRHHPNPDGVKTFIDRVSDVVQNRSPAASLVPTQEIKSMLDNFLVNLSNQLAGTFDGAPVVASSAPPVPNPTETEPVIPGAFVVPQTDMQTQTPAEVEKPVDEKDKPSKPSSKLGKGGFRHKHISCDGCLTGIRGMRYKCEVSSAIPQVDQANFCSNARTTTFAGHAFPYSTLRICIHPRIPSGRRYIAVSRSVSRFPLPGRKRPSGTPQLATCARCPSLA